MIHEAPIDSVGHGAVGVARIDGKVHFVPDALPGSVVRFEVTEDKGTWARGRLIDVVDPSPFATSPVCRHADTCGGCQWQHARPVAQREWKRRVVVDSLERIGGIEDPPVERTRQAGPPFGYRNRMDFSVSEGRPALHRRRSDELVALEECPVLHPLVEGMLGLPGLGGLDGFTLRAGVRTGARLVVINGDLPGGAEDWGVPVCRVSGGSVEPLVGDPFLKEVVAGVPFRITGSAFFQNSTEGADVLAEVAAAAAGRGGTLLDLYAGGGLFSCTIGRRFERVVAIESAGLATDDFAHNAAGLDHVELHRARVERSGDLLASFTGSTVIADPPRAGLGRKGVEVVVGAQPDKIVLVSCDPGSLGRDARQLREAGYWLAESVPLDLFPQTFHVEVVSTFER
ncbi:MAG: class I SAM-dependent RNA methyltransferase [Acidimicrobiia bacterium]|nr:class I SAM-dependent RNA methyltransferase [Acidimicrobiia bacterium]